MAETVRIEIPVSVKDNTSSGVQSATQNLSGFEKSMKRTEQQLNRIDRAHHIRVDADDRASGTINKLSSATESLDGTDADVDILASDSASQIVNQVENQINALDGSAADVDVGANDTATQVVSAAGDAVENFDGQSGDAEIGTDDSATPTIRAAEDAVETERDIVSNRVAVRYNPRRALVGDTDNGKALKERIQELKQLLDAYRKGVIKEKK